jgi:hypothetical protein
MAKDLEFTAKVATHITNSARKDEALQKLIDAWNSKNAKAGKRLGTFGFMAAALAACGNGATVVESTPPLDNTVDDTTTSLDGSAFFFLSRDNGGVVSRQSLDVDGLVYKDAILVDTNDVGALAGRLGNATQIGSTTLTIAAGDTYVGDIGLFTGGAIAVSGSGNLWLVAPSTGFDSNKVQTVALNIDLNGGTLIFDMPSDDYLILVDNDNSTIDLNGGSLVISDGVVRVGADQFATWNVGETVGDVVINSVLELDFRNTTMTDQQIADMIASLNAVTDAENNVSELRFLVLDAEQSNIVLNAVANNFGLASADAPSVTVSDGHNAPLTVNFDAVVATMIEMAASFIQAQITANDGDIALLINDATANGGTPTMNSIAGLKAALTELATTGEADIDALELAVGAPAADGNPATGLYLLIENAIQTAVDTLQNQITANDGDILSLIDDTVRDVNGDITTPATTNSIAGLKAALSTLETSGGADIDALELAVGVPAAGGEPATGLYLLIENAIQTAVNTLQNQITANDGDILSLIDDTVRDVNGDITTPATTNSIAGLKAALSTLETNGGAEIDALELAVGAPAADGNPATGLYLLVENAIQTAVNTLQNQITANDGDILSLIDDTVRDVNGDITTPATTNSIAGLKAALSTLETSGGAEIDALELAVGAPAADGNPATGLYLLIENAIKAVSLEPTLSVVGPDLNDGILESSEGNLVIRVSLPSAAAAGDVLVVALDGTNLGTPYTLLAGDITAGYFDTTITTGDLSTAGTKAITATISSGGITSPRSAGVFFDYSPDAIAPTISAIAVDSALGAQNNLLNAGDVVTVLATFSEAVTVDITGGVPSLELLVGGTPVQAVYAGGTGTHVLSFTYTILAAQADVDGISIAQDALSLNSGIITDLAGNDAVLVSAAVADNASFQVDTSAPTIAVGTMSADGAIDAADRLGQLVISGTTSAETGQLVTVGLNGKSYIGMAVNGSWSVVVDATDVAQLSDAGSASYDVTASVSDLAGNASVQATKPLAIDFAIDYLTSAHEILSLLGGAALTNPQVDASAMGLPQLVALAQGAASVTGEPFITGSFTITNQLSSTNISALLNMADSIASEVTVDASGMNALQLAAVGDAIAGVDRLQNLALSNAGLPSGAETLIGQLLGATAAGSVVVNGTGMSAAELVAVGQNIAKISTVTLSAGDSLTVNASNTAGTVFNGGTIVVTGNVGPAFFNGVTLNNVVLDLRTATTIANPFDLPATAEVIITAAQAEALTIVGRQSVDTLRIDVSTLPQHSVVEIIKGDPEFDSDVQMITLNGTPSEIVISGVNGANYFSKVIALEGNIATAIRTALNQEDAFAGNVTYVDDFGAGDFYVEFDRTLGDVAPLEVVTALRVNIDTRGDDDRVIFDFGAGNGLNEISLLGTLNFGAGRTTIDARSDIFEVSNGSVNIVNAQVLTASGSDPFTLVINSTVAITLAQLETLIASGQLQGIAGQGTINVIGEFPSSGGYVVDLGAVFPVSYTPGGLTIPTINFVSQSVTSASAVYLNPADGKFYDNYIDGSPEPDIYSNEVFRDPETGKFFTDPSRTSEFEMFAVAMPVVGTPVRVTFNGANPLEGFGLSSMPIPASTEVVVYTGAQLAALDALTQGDKDNISKVTIASDIVLTQDADLTAFATVVYEKPDSTMPRITVNAPQVLTISADQANGLAVNGTGTVVITDINASTSYDFSQITATNVSVVITDVFDARALQLGNIGFVVDNNVATDADAFDGLLTLTAAQASGRSIVANNLGEVVITGLGSSFVDLSGVQTNTGGTATAAVNSNLTLNGDTRLGDVHVTVADGRTLTVSAETADQSTITALNGVGTGSVVITGLSGAALDFTRIDVLDGAGSAIARVTTNVTLNPATALGEVDLEVAAGRTLTLSELQVGARAVDGSGNVVVTNLQFDSNLSGVSAGINLIGSISQDMNFLGQNLPAAWDDIDAFVIESGFILTLTPQQADGKIITGPGTVVIIGEGTLGTTADFDGIDAAFLDISQVTDPGAIGPINVAPNQTLTLTTEQRDNLFGTEPPFPDGVTLNAITIDNTYTPEEIANILATSNAIITVDATGMDPTQLSAVADGKSNVADIIGTLTLTSAHSPTQISNLLSRVVDPAATQVVADAAGMDAAQLAALADPINLPLIDSITDLVLTDANTAGNYDAQSETGLTGAQVINALLGSGATLDGSVGVIADSIDATRLAEIADGAAKISTITGALVIATADLTDVQINALLGRASSTDGDVTVNVDATDMTAADLVAIATTDNLAKIDSITKLVLTDANTAGNYDAQSETGLTGAQVINALLGSGATADNSVGVIADNIDETRLAEIADGAAKISDITGTLAISTAGLTSAQINALLEQASSVDGDVTVNVDAAGMDLDDITAIATAANLAKIDSITNLTLTDENTADAATIDRLLAVDAVKSVPLNGVDLTGLTLSNDVFYELIVGDVFLYYSGSDTVADIVAGLKTHPDYAGAAFTIAAVNDVIEITFDAPEADPVIHFYSDMMPAGKVVTGTTGAANVVATSMDATKLNAVAGGIDAVISNKITGVMSLNKDVLEANIPTLFGKYVGTDPDQALVNAQDMTAGQLIEVSKGISEVQGDGITNLTITKDVIVADTFSATGTVGGDNGSVSGPAVQTIAIGGGALQQGSAYTLSLDGVQLSVTLNGATPEVADLVAAFQALDTYASAPVTLTANAGTLTITYKTDGAKAAPELLMNAGDDGHIGRLLSKAVDDAVTVDITGMDNHQIEAVRDSVIKVGAMSSDQATIFEAAKTYWTIDGGQLTVDAVGGGTIKISTSGTPNVDITDKFTITTSLQNHETSDFITYTATLKPGENFGAVQPTLVVEYLRDINADTDFADAGETIIPTYSDAFTLVELPLIKPHVAALIDSLEIDNLTVTDTLTVKEATAIDIHNDGTPTILYDVLDSIANLQAVLDAGDPLRILRDAQTIDLSDAQPGSLADRLDIPADLATDLYGKFPESKADWINVTPDLDLGQAAPTTFTYVEVGTTAQSLAAMNITVSDLDLQNGYTGADAITSAQVTITSGGRATDLLAFNDQGGIFTTTYGGGTDLLVTVVAGQEANATAAAWSDMLNSLTFRSTSDTPNVIGNIQNITTNSVAASANDLRTVNFAGVEVVVGGEYTVTLGSNPFIYTATAGDTLGTIVDKLAMLIDASTAYTAASNLLAGATELRVTAGAGQQAISVVGVAGTRTLEITVADDAGARSAATVVDVEVESVNDQPTITYTVGATLREDPNSWVNYKLFSSFNMTTKELEENFAGAVLEIEIAGGRASDVIYNYFDGGASGNVFVNNVIIGTATQLNGLYTVTFNHAATEVAIESFVRELRFVNQYQELTDNETETREINVSFHNGLTADYSGTPYTIVNETTVNGILQEESAPVVLPFTTTGLNDRPELTSSIGQNNPREFQLYDNAGGDLDPTLDLSRGVLSSNGIRVGTNPDDLGELHLVRGTDVDISHTSLGLYVTAIDPYGSSGNGTWQVSTDNGVSWSNLRTDVHYANSDYIRYVAKPDIVSNYTPVDPEIHFRATDGIDVSFEGSTLRLEWNGTDATLFPNMQDINNPRFLIDVPGILDANAAVEPPVFKTGTFQTSDVVDRIIVGLGLTDFVAKFDNLSTQNEDGNSAGDNFDGAANVITGLSVSRPGDIANALRDATTEEGPVVALIWNSNVNTSNPARMELWVDYRVGGIRAPELVGIFDGSNFDNLGDMESFGWQDFVIVNTADPTASNTLGDAASVDDQILFGHEGDDTLTGGEGSDILVGARGDDTINTGAGRDVAYGGAGADTVNLGIGDDFADGGIGNDTITSGLGNDLIIGNAGDDTINLSPAQAQGTAGSAAINSKDTTLDADRTVALESFTVLEGATYSVSIGNAAKASSIAIAGLTTNAVNSITDFNLELDGQPLLADLTGVNNLAALTTAINNVAGISASFDGFTMTIMADSTSAILSVSGASAFTADGSVVGTGGATVIAAKAAMTDFTTFSYTAVAGDEVNDVAAGLATAINGNFAYGASATGSTITIADGAGAMELRFDAPLSGTDTIVFGVTSAQNGFDVINDFAAGPLEWGGDRIMLVDFAPSENDATLISGGLDNALLRGTGLYGEKLGAGNAIGANTGLVLYTTDVGSFTPTGPFDIGTVQGIIATAAEGLTGELANDAIYMLASDGSDAVLARVTYSAEDTASVDLLAKFNGMDVADIASLSNDNFVNFGVLDPLITFN